MSNTNQKPYIIAVEGANPYAVSAVIGRILNHIRDICAVQDLDYGDDFHALNRIINSRQNLASKVSRTPQINKCIITNCFLFGMLRDADILAEKKRTDIEFNFTVLDALNSILPKRPRTDCLVIVKDTERFDTLNFFDNRATASEFTKYIDSRDYFAVVDGGAVATKGAIMSKHNGGVLLPSDTLVISREGEQELATLLDTIYKNISQYQSNQP